MLSLDGFLRQFSLVEGPDGLARPAGFRYAELVRVRVDRGDDGAWLGCSLEIEAALLRHPAESWWARQLIEELLTQASPSPLFQTLAREAAGSDPPPWLQEDGRQQWTDAGLRLDCSRAAGGALVLLLELADAQRCKNCQALNGKDQPRCRQCQTPLKRKLWFW